MSAQAATEGMEVRARHPYGYRSGEWARIAQVLQAEGKGDIWMVTFPDGDVDWWPAADPDAEYELREARP